MNISICLPLPVAIDKKQIARTMDGQEHTVENSSSLI